MNRVRDNSATEYVVEPQPPAPGLHIEGYGLLYEGRPLLVEDDSLEYSGYGGCLDHYVISQDFGMPYLVDLHTMRYYLATYHLKGKSYSKPYKPQDSYNLVGKATPCHMVVSMTVGSIFSLRVTTKPLAAPIEPYKLLPHDCLNNTYGKVDTVLGTSGGEIIKMLNYTPADIGGEYVDNGGFTVDTYIGPVEPGPSTYDGRCGIYKPGPKRKLDHHTFRRESRYPEFYESLDMTSILALERGMSDG